MHANRKVFIIAIALCYNMKGTINWQRVSEERRGKILWIARQKLFDLFLAPSQDSTQVTRLKLPEDWQLRDVHYDFLRDSFGFVIISPQFPMNPPSVELPPLDFFNEVIKVGLRKQ